MLSKYTSPYIPADNMLMHEALAVMHMKPLFNDAEITRTFIEKQGDFFASLPDYKLAGEIKTFDSPFNEYTMNARLETGVGKFFSNLPKNEGLKSLLVLDASVTPVSSEEEFRIIKNGVLAKCDPINLDKFDLITCRQDLLSLNSKPGLLILHESEQRLLYPKLSSKLQEEYESFDANTRKLWEDPKMREKFLDFLLHKQKAKQGGF